MATLSYRLRIRNGADNADALIISSVSGGTNPYIKAAPHGDGQEVDPLTGAVRTGTYTIEVVDALTSGTSRVLTSQLFDGQGRQQMLSRRAYIEQSTDLGSTWTGLVAGYLINYRLADAITWEIQVGDTRRIETTKVVFDGSSTTWAKRGCIFGGPITGGGWGPITDRTGWKFQVVQIDAASAGTHIVSYGLVSGYRGVNDALNQNAQAVLAQTKDSWDNWVNQAAKSYYSSNVPPYGNGGFAGLRALVAELMAGPTAGVFIPAPVFDYADNIGPVMIQARVSGFTRAGTPGYTAAFRLLWPAAVTLPAVNDVHTISLFAAVACDASPVYLTEHPVDVVTKLWTDAGIAYDASAASTVRTLLGDTLRVSMRITQSTTLLDFLEKQIFGPFGISARTGSAGTLVLFTTRLKQTGVPATTFGTADLQGAHEVIFDNDEATVVSSLRFKTEVYWAYDPNVSTDQQHPLDSVMVSPSEIAVANADVSAFSTKEVVYEMQGMIHDVKGVATDMVAMATSVAEEMFDRFGRGAPVMEMAILRASDTGFAIGDELYIQPAHLPNLNKRLGDDPSVGARIVQVLRRTESPEGAVIKCMDAGSDQQPVTPAAVITIAANANAPRLVAEFTVTNAAAINATAVLLTAVQWATGTSSPANGVGFARYSPGTTPTGATQLPPVVPGSTVWVRARTEQDGRRPSAWTAWTSVALTAITTPTLGSVLGQGFRTVQFEWTPANATDLTDFFVAAPGPQVPAGLFVIGQSYRILWIGSTDFTLLGAASNTPGLVFTATGAGTGGVGVGAAALQPAAWLIAAGAFVIGQTYMIMVVGSTNFVAIGAGSNSPGQVFTATGAGSGTGFGALQPADFTPYFAATAPAGATSISVDVPPPGGVGASYFYAFCARDPVTGRRGTMLTGSTGTANRTTTCVAPRLQAINAGQDQQGSLTTGVALALYRTDTLDLRIQRAPDASGVPGTWYDLTTVRGSTETYIDRLPFGVSYWYRVTHSGPSNNDNFSGALYATSQSVPGIIQPPAYSVNTGVYVGHSSDALSIAIANLLGAGTIELGAGETATIAADLALPVGVTLRGLSRSSKSIIKGTGGQILRMTGQPATQRGGCIENMVFDGVAVLLGDTVNDYGVGSVLKGLEFKNVTSGYPLTYRHHSYLTLADDVFIHDCAGASGGIDLDFAGAVSDSGARMVFRALGLFSLPIGVLIDGMTTDGCSLMFEHCDIEHCTSAGVKATGMSDGVAHFTDLHMEHMDDMHFDLVGGNVFVNGFDFFPLGSTYVKVFKLNATRLFLERGRLQWNVSKLCELFSGAVLSINPDHVFSNGAFFGKEAIAMATATGGQAGLIVCGGAGYAGSGYIRGGKVFAGRTNETGSITGTSSTMTVIEQFDASQRIIEFDIAVTIGGATSNTLRIYLNGGSSQFVDLAFPVATGKGHVRIVYTPGAAFNILARYNNVDYTGTFNDTSTSTTQRFIDMQSVGAGPSTIAITAFCEDVR